MFYAVISSISVARLCLTLCNPRDWSTPGFPVHHQLLELAQTHVHVHWVSDAIQPSHPLLSLSFCLQFFPASRSFPMSWFFASGGQTIGASASASVLPMNIQNWFPLGWTGWISLKSKGLSRIGFNAKTKIDTSFSQIFNSHYICYLSHSIR